jgi:hypothetical protein
VDEQEGAATWTANSLHSPTENLGSFPLECSVRVFSIPPAELASAPPELMEDWHDRNIPSTDR